MRMNHTRSDQEYVCENIHMEPFLPHGARGIEGDNFALQFLADKIVFVPRSGTENGRD